jgi:hypothetical protein
MVNSFKWVTSGYDYGFMQASELIDIDFRPLYYCQGRLVKIHWEGELGHLTECC